MPGTMRKDAIGRIAKTRYAPIISKRSCYLILWIKATGTLTAIDNERRRRVLAYRDMPRPAYSLCNADFSKPMLRSCTGPDEVAKRRAEATLGRILDGSREAD